MKLCLFKNRAEVVIVAYASFAFGALIYGWVGCTPAQLDQVANISDKKNALCDFAAVWAPDTPTLVKVRELCATDADAQAIMQAYAGCSAEPSTTEVEGTEAGAPMAPATPTTTAPVPAPASLDAGESPGTAASASVGTPNP